MYGNQRSKISPVPVLYMGTSSVPFIQVFESNYFSAVHMSRHLLCIGDTTHTHTFVRASCAVSTNVFAVGSVAALCETRLSVVSGVIVRTG